MKVRFQFCVIFHQYPSMDPMKKRIVSLNVKDAQRVCDIFMTYPRDGLYGLRNVKVSYLEKTEFVCEFADAEGLMDCYRFLDFYPDMFLMGEKMMMRGRIRRETLETEIDRDEHWEILKSL